MRNDSNSIRRSLQESLIFCEDSGKQQVEPRSRICRPVWPMNAWYNIRDSAVMHNETEAGTNADALA